jgi:hypothetical protein
MAESRKQKASPTHATHVLRFSASIHAKIRTTSPESREQFIAGWRAENHHLEVKVDEGEEEAKEGVRTFSLAFYAFSADPKESLWHRGGIGRN